jgi:hypothetical protein
MSSIKAQSEELVSTQRKQVRKFPLKLWQDGAWVFARFLWFMLIWLIAMQPWSLIHWLLNPTDAAPIKNGQIHLRASCDVALLLIYLPFSFLIASRCSGQFEKTSYPEV